MQVSKIFSDIFLLVAFGISCYICNDGVKETLEEGLYKNLGLAIAVLVILAMAAEVYHLVKLKPKVNKVLKTYSKKEGSDKLEKEPHSPNSATNLWNKKKLKIKVVKKKDPRTDRPKIEDFSDSDDIVFKGEIRNKGYKGKKNNLFDEILKPKSLVSKRINVRSKD